MSRRYLFWRTPEGRPYRENDGKHSPSELLAEYGRKSSVNPDGTISRPDFSFLQLEVAFKLAAVIVGPDGEALNEHDTWNIMRSALIDAVKGKGGRQPLDSSHVLGLADAKAAEFYRREASNYTLVSSLSVRELPIKRIEVSGCQIGLLASRRGYAYPENIQTKVDRLIAEHIDSTNYRHVCIKTRGRSRFEAADRAIRALHLLRGLWSIFATYGSLRLRISGVRSDPIGVIHTGPIHTLHLPDKSCVDDLYWYEHQAREERELFRPRDGWGKLEKNRRWAMNHMRRHPFRTEVEELIVRYVLALDQADHDIAFLQMWSILEKITNTIGRHEETLNRTVWPFPHADRKLAKNILDCIRLQRNLYVHAAKSLEASDQAAYLIKTFVDPHLVNLIRNAFAVTSFEEHGQQLSLPTDLAALKRNKRWAEKAMRMKQKEGREMSVTLARHKKARA